LHAAAVQGWWGEHKHPVRSFWEWRRTWPWNQVKDLKHTNKNLRFQIRRLEEDNRHQLSRLDDIIPKLVQVTASPLSYASEHYRIQMDFNSDMIREGLMHGDDQAMLRAFADRIGMMALRELTTINFARYSRHRFYQGEAL